MIVEAGRWKPCENLRSSVTRQLNFHVCKVSQPIAINFHRQGRSTFEWILLSSKSFFRVALFFSRPKIERKTFSWTSRLSFFIRKFTNTTAQSSMTIFNDWGFRFWQKAHANWELNCLLLLTRWGKFLVCFVSLVSDEFSSRREEMRETKSHLISSRIFLLIL